MIEVILFFGLVFLTLSPSLAFVSAVVFCLFLGGGGGAAS